ncbi:MAG: preprotein translocase subunit SecY [Firmicutes bacterium]|nr:preprotein translocase subunit SecY [Bacillota bacterium]
MVATLTNAWKIKDIRRKLLFTLAMLFVFRLGSFVPVPGIDADTVSEILSGGGDGTGGILGMFDMFAGGALSQFSIFAMGIMPYINASIIMTLLQTVIPKFEEWSKEGPEGRKKLNQFTRYGTVLLGFIQSTGMAWAFQGAIGVSRVVDPLNFYTTLAIIALTLTAGTAFLMWLGEQITDKGIGNGISIIIFAGIISRLPITFTETYQMYRVGEINVFNLVAIAVLALVVIAGVVYIQQGERRIPVQYAKRVVGRRMYGGASSHIPLKVNQAGVIPVIFASSILLFPETIAQFWQNDFLIRVSNFLRIGSPFGTTLYVIAIVFFSYFYTAITVNPNDLADNMRKNGGFIPGIRPGRPTAGYIERIINRITLAGAVFLAIIVVLPFALNALTGIQMGLGGTALLIVVGVALETMKQIESQMLMRHYKGFM